MKTRSLSLLALGLAAAVSLFPIQVRSAIPANRIRGNKPPADELFQPGPAHSEAVTRARGGRAVRAHPGLRHGQEFLLELGPGATWTVQRQRVDELGKGDFVWTGQVVGNPFSRVTVSSRGGVIAGVVDLPWQDGNEVWEIVPGPDGTSALVSSTIPAEVMGCDLEAVPGGSAITTGVLATQSDPTVIEVMVLYTPATTARYGQSGAEAKILQAIADANSAYAQSQVYLTVHLAYMAEVAYTETGLMTDALTRLRTNGDGYMDQAHLWRDQYGADLVVLVDEDASACGQAYLMSSPSSSFAPYGFSVVNSGCLGGYSMAHEMGHNMGCEHDHANAAGSPAYPYAYGYINCASDGTGFRSIMAYPCGIVPRLNYFSNPDVLINGLPAGIDYEADPANASDNARSLNQTAPVVAAFRSGPQSPPAAPTGLTATTASVTAISLQWTDASADETGFALERSLDGFAWSEIATLPAGSSTFLDEGLQLGTTYFYRVRAYNSLGYSTYSNVASASPAELPPAAPTNLNASAISSSLIDLAWTDASLTESGFELQRSLDGGTWDTVATVGANVTTHRDTGLTANTTYAYRVRAFSAAGTSAFSNTASATTTPGVIVAVTVTSVGSEDGFILELNETSETGGTAYATYNTSGALRIGDNYQDRQYRSIVSFDTSTIPEGVTLVSARLRLKRSGVSGTDPFTTHGVCWVDIKSGAFNGSQALAATDFEAAADASRVGIMGRALNNGEWCEAPLNPAALSWVNTTGKTQFRVYLETGDDDDAVTDYYGWYSGENSVADNRPQLVVEYSSEPPQPPAAPSSLTATGISPSQIHLGWTDNADDETGFRVERSPDLVNWSVLATLAIDATGFDDVGLNAGATWHYRVFAFNTEGDSPSSDTASATTPMPVTITAQFQSVGAQDGYLLEKNENAETGSNAYASNTGSAAIRAGDTVTDQQYRGLVSFDTSSIPDGATIISATLRLKQSNIAGTDPFLSHGSCWVDVATGGFNGSVSLTKEDFQAAASVARVAALSRPGANGAWSEGILNAAGRTAVNKTGTTQFRIAFNAGDDDDATLDYVGWYSGENSVVTNRPELVIEYQQ